MRIIEYRKSNDIDIEFLDEFREKPDVLKF